MCIFPGTGFLLPQGDVFQTVLGLCGCSKATLNLAPSWFILGQRLETNGCPSTGSMCGNKSQSSRKDAWGNIACVAKRLYNNTAVSGLAGKLICIWGFCSGMIVAVLLKTGICSSATATFLAQIKITASPNSLPSTFSNPIMHKGLDDGSWWLAAASPHVLRQTPAGWRTPGRVRMWFLSVKHFGPLNYSSSEAGNASAQECCFLLPLCSSDQRVTSGKRWWHQSREVCFTPGY